MFGVFINVELVCLVLFGSLQQDLLERTLHGVSSREAADESIGGMLQ